MTIKDIAKECGCAIGTVSRVLNNHPDVSEKTRQKVMAVVEKHGFVLNTNAKQLKTQDRKNIVIIVKGASSTLLNGLLEKIQKKIENLPYTASVVVLDESDKFDEENYNNYHKRNLTKGKNNRTKYGLSTKNPEMDKVYQRLNDLRKLELNYSKDINKSKKNFVMSPLALTEIYYNFKKRYMRSKKKNLYSNTDRSNKPDLPNLVTISSTSIPPKKRNKSTQENGKNGNSLNNTIPSKTTYLTSTNQPNTLSTTSKNFYTTKSVGMKSSYSQTVSTKL